MHYLLFYDVVEGYVEKRAAFRAAHLEHARRARERGELLLAGALADPVDGAVLLFRGSSPEVAEAFARADPYVTHGLVTRWRVREWTTVVGEQASTPVPSRSAPTDGVARVWRGVVAGEGDAITYLEHLAGSVLPSLAQISGHRGATVLRRSSEAGIEFVVATFWDSMDAIRAFAGDSPERAVVKPEARAVLTDFEEVVRHYRVAYDTTSAADNLAFPP